MNAVETTLIHRGLGKGPDADAGYVTIPFVFQVLYIENSDALLFELHRWEKVWRAACWAQLQNTSMAYTELKYTISENIVQNLLSMYSAKSPPFQIDANFGFGGAVLAMLVKDVDYNFGEWDVVTRRVVLGPAIPQEWANGNVRGLRLRGGMIIDFAWDGEGVVEGYSVRRNGSLKVKCQFVNSMGKILQPL